MPKSLPTLHPQLIILWGGAQFLKRIPSESNAQPKLRNTRMVRRFVVFHKGGTRFFSKGFARREMVVRYWGEEGTDGES